MQYEIVAYFAQNNNSEMQPNCGIKMITRKYLLVTKSGVHIDLRQNILSKS